MAMDFLQVQHLGHEHPLMLIKTGETDDILDLTCYFCEQPIPMPSSSSSSYYGCKRCLFFLHKPCAEIPRTMTHPFHPQHPLTLLLPNPYSLTGNTCDVCREKINRLFYRCDDCDYDIDVKCALAVLCIRQSIGHKTHPLQLPMEVIQVQHLGHDHPLMLINKEETDGSWDLSCYGCEQPISFSSSSSSSYYGCKGCVFFLHRTCAQLPHQMTHPSHPQHLLTLLPNTSPRYNTSHAICDVCRERCNRFIYHCSLCKYDIDMKCALAVLSIQQSINHTSHPHQLIPLQKESKIFCDACGEEHKGTSFLCTTCGFWINQKCASSPINIKLNNHHHHILSLIYFLPEEIHCSICSEKIFRRSWAYSCSKCHYLVHFHCVASDKEYSQNNGTEDQIHDLDHNPINLSSSNSAASTSDADLHKGPVTNDAADIITKFIKNTAIQGKHKEAAEIKHGSHQHPLTLHERPIDHALSTLSNGASNVQKCCGCAQSISAPFYCCLECEFYLHVWCAELPEELKHPGHRQHTLFLSKDAEAGKCYCCDLFAATLLYKCEECNFSLDLKCASLPRVIKHESHDKHTLALRPRSLPSTCISCKVSLSMSFECWSCKFNLCIRCALLPHTVRHRNYKHPFALTYSPLQYRTDDNFCELCKEGIDSNRWFYHCGECDQYLHTDCILPVDQFSNMVYNDWNPINSRKHPHRLIRVARNPNTSCCSLCERSNADSDHYLCPPCDFFLCDSCEKKEIQLEI